MSKTKRKSRSKTEHLEGLVKKLQSEIRRLKQHNRELSKRAHFYEEVVDEAVEDVSIEDVCPECGKGILQKLDFYRIIITKCNLCGYQPKK